MKKASEQAEQAGDPGSILQMQIKGIVVSVSGENIRFELHSPFTHLMSLAMTQMASMSEAGGLGSSNWGHKLQIS
jgi:hypothetical protein